MASSANIVNIVGITVLNPIQDIHWNSKIAKFSGTTIFHTANWAQVLAESYGYQPRYFCTTDHGRITNVVPMMGIDSPLTGKRGVSLPFSDQVEPLVAEMNRFTQLHNSMREFGRKKGWQCLSFHGGETCLGSNPTHRSYIHSWIELGGPEQLLFNNLKSSNRRNIRKAEKAGVVVNVDRSLKGVRAFYRLNCLTRKEHGLPPQPFSFFEKMYTHIVKKGYGFVCLAFIDNVPVAGVVIFYFQKRALYKYGASDKRFLYVRPNNLCMWRAIQWCSKNGFTSFDLGRTDMDHHGLIRFKRSWNAKEKVLHYYKYDFKKERFLTGKPKLKSSYAVFHRMPVPFLRIVGQLLYRHVG